MVALGLELLAKLANLAKSIGPCSTADYLIEASAKQGIAMSMNEADTWVAFAINWNK